MTESTLSITLIEPPKVVAKPAPVTPKSAMQKLMEKLGLKRDIDLALHLPLRYEDETHISRLRDAREGDQIQIEGQVVDCEVVYKPRKQLLVKIDDGSDICTLRFFNFYPNQQKALGVGNRILARGEVRGGFLGWTMLHPHCKPGGGDLPTALTPIYPTVAGMPQAYLRKAVLGGLARAELSDTFPPGDLSQFNPRALWTLRQALPGWVAVVLQSVQRHIGRGVVQKLQRLTQRPQRTRIELAQVSGRKSIRQLGSR